MVDEELLIFSRFPCRMHKCRHHAPPCTTLLKIKQSLDIQEHAVYWSTPKGTICASLREMSAWMEDQFVEPANDEAYEAIGRQMNWEILGICQSEGDLAQYLADPGTIADERWKALAWSKPEKDTMPCWWLVLLVKYFSQPQSAQELHNRNGMHHS